MTYLLFDEDYAEWVEWKLEVSGSDTLLYVNGKFMDAWKDTILSRTEFEAGLKGSKFKKVA